MAARLAWKTGYESDELALGVALAIALHVIPIAAIVLRAMYPAPPEIEAPLVAKPVIGATLLKLGKPIDPKKLPDRLVPQKRTAPQHDTVASREDRPKEHADAGPPPPNAENSDITKLIDKSDLFAEDAGKVRPDEGFAEGSDAGTETDPAKVHAGDEYAARLGKFLADRMEYPSVISEAEARRLCAIYQININPRMQIWHLQEHPIRSSGNDLFDDAARTMLQKLLDDRTSLPEPPSTVAEQFKGRTVNIAVNPGGDPNRCK